MKDKIKYINPDDKPHNNIIIDTTELLTDTDNLPKVIPYDDMPEVNHDNYLKAYGSEDLYLYTKDGFRYYTHCESIYKYQPTKYLIEETLSYVEGAFYDYIEYVYKVPVFDNELYFKTIFYDERWHKDTRKYIEKLKKGEDYE